MKPYNIEATFLRFAERRRFVGRAEDIPDGPPDFVSPLGSEAGGVAWPAAAAASGSFR